MYWWWPQADTHTPCDDLLPAVGVVVVNLNSHCTTVMTRLPHYCDQLNCFLEPLNKGHMVVLSWRLGSRVMSFVESYGGSSIHPLLIDHNVL